MAERKMSISEIVSAFGGTRIDPSKLSRYESWALGLFHDRRYVADPNLETTLQLDITEADNSYRDSFAQTRGASLTAYLVWTMLKTMADHPCFSYRDLDGEWYSFERLPLFFPVATGTKERFQEVLIDDACALDWEEFCSQYRGRIERAVDGGAIYSPIPYETWSVAHFIGDLPDFQFTSLHLHTPVAQTGRPVFYFGKRYVSDGRLMVPLYILFDHSNLDPVVLNAFLEDYGRRFCC